MKNHLNQAKQAIFTEIKMKKEKVIEI